MSNTSKGESGDQNSGQSNEENLLKSAADIALERSAAQGNGKDGEGSAAAAVSAKEIEELRAQAAKAKDLALRTQADLENYRKRVARERQDLIKSANEKLLLEILPALDSFEMGLQSVQKKDEKDPLLQGMEMVYSQFKQFLKSQGVVEVETVGKQFDPSVHEAVAHQESDLPEGQIVQQLRKGYRLQDKLLRAASVIVSKGKPEKKTEEVSSNAVSE